MKIPLKPVFLVILFWLALSCTNRERKMEYYADGKVKTEVDLVNGLRQGKATGYLETGAIEWKENYVNDSLDGLYLKYYPNKLLQRKMEFSHGKLNSNYFEYYENGNLKQKGQFIKGVKDGPFLVYYHNGNKIVESFIKNGNTRFCTHYDSLGNATDKRRYASLRITGQLKVGNSIKIADKIPDFTSNKEIPLYTFIGRYGTKDYGGLRVMKYNTDDSSFYYTFAPFKLPGKYLIKTFFYEKNEFPNHSDTLVTVEP